MILNCHDRLYQVSIVLKTRLENYVTDHVDVVYAKNKTDQTLLIGLGTMSDENQTGQRCEWSYRSGLSWNWN